MNWQKIIAVAVLLAGALAASVFLPGALASLKGGASVTAQGLPEASEFSPSLLDSAIYQALAEGGMEGAIVEATQNKVRVTLQVPQGADARKTAFFALGAAGAIAPAESTVSVEVFDGESKTTYSARAADVQELLELKINEQEFEARVSQK